MFGERIAEQRKKLGLSQEELAEKLNISQKSISKYERGDRRPSYEVLVLMAALFDVTTDYLLGEEICMVGTRIAELRKGSGMTQGELGEKLGVIKQTVSAWEKGISKVGNDTLITLSRLFGVTTDYLLGLTEGEDTMGTEENTNEIMQRVGRNLRTLRESKSIFTQQQLAERLGVGASTVGMWEQGRREPDLDTLARIAQFFEVTLDDLVMKELTPPIPLYVQNMIYLRKKIGYSQSEMAMELGLQGPSSIDIVESGKCELPVSKLIHLAEFFRVTMDQITKKDLSQEVSGCRQQ